MSFKNGMWTVAELREKPTKALEARVDELFAAGVAQHQMAIADQVLAEMARRERAEGEARMLMISEQTLKASDRMLKISELLALIAKLTLGVTAFAALAAIVALFK